MRTLVFGGAIIALVLALSACGGSSESSATDETQLADKYAIRQIEENFHESHVQEGHRPVDEPVGAACDLQFPGEDGGGHPADPGHVVEVGRRSSRRHTGSPTTPRGR